MAVGTVKVTSSLIEQNQADWYPRRQYSESAPGPAGVGGAGQGGGVDVQGGTVTISQSQIENNTAQGGDGGGVLNSQAHYHRLATAGGGAAGGGIYVGGGTVNLTTDVIQSNQATLALPRTGRARSPPSLPAGGSTR